MSSRTQFRRLFVVAVVAVTVLAGVQVGLVGAQSGTAVSVGPSPAAGPDAGLSGEQGEQVTATVWVNASGVAGYQTALSFDPSVVQVERVSGAGAFGDPVVNIDNQAGTVSFNQLRDGGVDDPVVAELVLTLTGTAGERTDLSLVEGETVLSSDGAESIPVESYRGTTVEVVGPTPTPTATPTPTPTPSTTPTPTPTVTPTPSPTPTPTPTPTPEPDDSDDSDNSDNSDDSDDSDDRRSSGGGGGGGSSAPPATPSLSIRDAVLDNESVQAGSRAFVRVTVENEGRASGDFTARLFLDGTEVERSQPVTIDPGETREVVLNETLAEPGTFELRVNSFRSWTVSVTPTPTPTPTMTPTATPSPTPTPTATQTPTPTPTATPAPTTTVEASPTATESVTSTFGAGPGFGVVAGVLALVAALLLVRRRG